MLHTIYQSEHDEVKIGQNNDSNWVYVYFIL